MDKANPPPILSHKSDCTQHGGKNRTDSEIDGGGQGWTDRREGAES